MSTDLWIVEIMVNSLAVFILWVLPTLSRPDLCFGVTVPQRFQESGEGQRIVRHYRRTVLLLGAAAIAALFLPPVALGIVASVLLLAGGWVWAWGVAHRATRDYAVTPPTERSAAVGATDGAPPADGLLTSLGPFLLLGGTAFYSYYYYGLLPDPFPVHWSAGHPDRFVPKTLLAVLKPLIVASSICFLMSIVRWSQANRNLTRRLTLTGDHSQEPAFHKMNLRSLLILQYMIAAIFTWRTLVLRGPHLSQVISTQWGHYGTLVIAFAPLPYVFYLSTRYGQGGWRLSDRSAQTTGQPRGDRTPDGCWKLGQFYFNPDDPAVWVQARAGVGYALNFARPLAWILLLSFLLGPLVVILLIRR